MTWADVDRVWLQNSAGVRVDITPYVRAKRMDISATRGRSTELDQIGTGSLTMAVDDSTGLFTPGSASAALEITLGMPVWWTEVIGNRQFELFAGFCQVPDSVEDINGVDNLITVTAVDRKELLNGGRTLISTLAEQIRYAGGSTLIAHWPLGDASTERTALGVVGSEPTISYTTTNAVLLANVAGPVGDDLQAPTFVDAGSATPNSAVAAGTWETADRLNIVTGDEISFVFWAKFADRDPATAYADALQIDGNGTVFIGLNYSSNFPVWNAGADISGWGPIAGVNGPSGAAGSWTLIALRFGLRASQDFWVGAAQSVLNFGAGAPASMYINRIQLSPLTHWSGQISQIQVYRNGYTWAQHLEQLRQGYAGLAGQRTDERVATMLSYASPTVPIPAGLDVGSTFMPRVSLAGRQPGSVIDEAVTTERGRLFVNGSGTTVLHSRVRAYNL